MNVDDLIAYENGELDGDGEADFLQMTINEGMWGLQGSYGRAMMAAIEDGICLLGKNTARDYYNNAIPSREQVQAGTKGSYDYVAERMGKEHADRMAAL